jgi:pilus assembly protein Flp/PilA
MNHWPRLDQARRLIEGMLDEGQGLVEYALIIAVIAIAVIIAMLFLRDQISNIFSNIGNNLT